MLFLGTFRREVQRCLSKCQCGQQGRQTVVLVVPRARTQQLFLSQCCDRVTGVMPNEVPEPGKNDLVGAKKLTVTHGGIYEVMLALVAGPVGDDIAFDAFVDSNQE